MLQSPSDYTRTLANDARFVPVKMPDARVLAYVRRLQPELNAAPLTVYIESDGAPWRVADEPPADPTPLKPLVLSMAIADSSPATAYLGRPCQYLAEADRLKCDPRLWMQARFGEEAVVAMNQAVDQLKLGVGATAINLVGYSGGGAMAALIAARRNDVNCLVTVASPLDTNAWTDALRVSRLDLSMNPVDVAVKLQNVRQTHFRGLRDHLVPPPTSQRFLERVAGATVVDKATFDHQCCWSDEWRELRRSSCLAQ